ncbi:hypothetical protein GCM10009769_12270 [Curtobacterium luteum]|uniref:Uncharacterized protein n=1 Tax=Curtobacterium luteum TaxID=33881 RepID=A0A8H9G8T5_9MICO|nr:hypothetical protein GCM10009769_12270 [Curtobacterium luteum]
MRSWGECGRRRRTTRLLSYDIGHVAACARASAATAENDVIDVVRQRHRRAAAAAARATATATATSRGSGNGSGNGNGNGNGSQLPTPGFRNASAVLAAPGDGPHHHFERVVRVT